VGAFVNVVERELKAVGLAGAHLLQQSSEGNPFGDTDAVFGLGSLLIRVVKDRGQVFVDLASSESPSTFHELDDVDIAMGWKTVEQVLGKKEPEPLNSILGRLAAHQAELLDMFSAPRERLTRARLQRIAQERGTEMINRIKSGA
jgi:hypothetical protein